MRESGFPIPGHEDEKIVYLTRKHIVSMLRTIILVALMIIMPIILLIAALVTKSAMFNGLVFNFVVVFGSIYFLIVATFAFAQWTSYYFDIFVVTDKAIIDVDQEGFFDRRITEVSILRIQDVSARVKGFFPTMFNYGDVVAESAGENSHTYIIDDVPDPTGIANRILALHNEHVSREERAAELITAEGDLRADKQNGPPGYKPFPKLPADAPIQAEQTQEQETVSDFIPEEEHIARMPDEINNNVNQVEANNSQDAVNNREDFPDGLAAGYHNAGQGEVNKNSSQGEADKNDLDQGGEFKL